MSTIIIKTDAIPLRISPFSNTSHIVTWLTQDHGKVATVIKGACRPKSLVLGQYDIGYLCELLFYAREHNGLHIIKECAALNDRKACRGNWQSSTAISYLCHLSELATPHGTHSMELYDILSQTLDIITPINATTTPPAAKLTIILLSFEIQLLKILGMPPSLARCTNCRSGIVPEHNNMFSAEKGGIICQDCAPLIRDRLPLSGNALATMRRWLTSPQIVQTPLPQPDQQLQIQNTLGEFLTHHIDLSPHSRNVAYQMVAIPSSRS